MRHLWSVFTRCFRARPCPHASVSAFQPGRIPLEVEALEDRTLLSTNPVIGTGAGLTGHYYGDRVLGRLVATRVDSAVNMTWGQPVSPIAGVGSVNYSVRWTGAVQAQFSETYTFTTYSDDGIRLTVNGQRVIDYWTDHAPRYDSGRITLKAGQKYDIQLDYYQAYYLAVARLFWSSASTPQQIVPTRQLYAASGSSPTPPSARLSAADVSAPTASTTYRVSFTDNVAVDASSLGTGDIRVTGPNGFNQLPTFVGVDAAGSGPSRTATYLVNGPGGTWDLADNGTYTVALQGTQVRDTAGAYAAAATLGTFRVAIPGSDWFSQNLHDATLVGLVRGLDADRQLSRADLLSVFSQLEKDGTVSAAELGDLRTIVGNASTLGINDATHVLANKVVNGDPADRHYQGQTLADLTAGSAAWLLQDLVGKWFLGTDHPVVAAGTHYAAAAGSLFGNGPSYADVKQGQVGDCYFLAGLSEIAYRDPASIRNMFIDNGDGTYTVRFYHNGTADYVTVDRQLAATAGGAFEYANFQGSLNDAANKLWVPLVEKAYAQLAESGWSRPGQAANAYDSIAYGWEGEALRAVANRSIGSNALGKDDASLNAIVNAFRQGKTVGLDSNATTETGIVSSHVYVLIGYDANAREFTCYNPWGYTQILTWGQVTSNFRYWSA